MKLIAIYRPPPSKKIKFTTAVFLDEFEDLIDSYVTDQQQIILLGDINFHYDSTTDNYVKKLKTMLNNRNLRQAIDEPTHIKTHTLDWLILREDDTSIYDIQVADKALSDHFVITFTIAIDRPKVEKKTVTSRNIKQLDHEELSNEVKAIAIEHSPNDTSTSLVEKYNITLEKLLDKHAPLRARTITDRTSAPLINADVKLQKQQRRQAECAWRKEKTTVKRQIYQYHHKRVKKTINNAKRDYYRSKISSCSTSKALFRLTSTLSGKSKSTPLPDQITDDKLPDSFCAYFHD
ncbi:hypothetical protein ElyMa_005813900 [Elysia marginata]|uniref:Endonuclease/exonuclease/phosphatase domain-containing protein n=1 Tax=Elysia marginata TaxID=1093978 RepID=A0AAV4FV36_9GAST|nr:hypothetical protein ElyMa_005813900 [Elysia marginata]